MIDLSEKNIYLYIFLLVLIILALFLQNNRKNNEYRKENEEYKRILYRNKDYKCKGIEYYSENGIQKITRIYNTLPLDMQNDLEKYAERLERQMISAEYSKK